MKITLRSGRELSANEGILGLTPDLELSEGYDGMVYFDGDEESPDLTPAEKEEIADIMIDRWKRWAGHREHNDNDE